MEKTRMKSSNALNCLLGLSLSSYADGYAILHFHGPRLCHQQPAQGRDRYGPGKERYTTLLESELPPRLQRPHRVQDRGGGGGMFRSKAIVMNFVTFKEDASLPPNTVDFSMSRSEQNTMQIRVPTNLASRAPIGLNDSAIALYDYQADGEGEITITEGEEIVIMNENDDGWWMGKKDNGEKGLFPGNYVKKL
ncbi:hypothetical protein TrRE_jg6667 [Triparma retinervis]|uniref:SH3 domain-containing protein n=1 Tax=Triparma retinervis TaxID=2557542 RepID=A0A9W7DT63_9STRA|nr:hypothetical protein TrRE_jg6667 [Triparma retinervis]